MTNASELLPCPFCGSEPEITSREYSDDKANYGDCYIDCPTCHAEQPWRATKEAAIAAWNTRQVTQLEAQLAEVREGLARFVRARDDYLEAGDDTVTELVAAGELDRAHEHARALLTKEPK